MNRCERVVHEHAVDASRLGAVVCGAVASRLVECTFDAYRYPGADCRYAPRANECVDWWPGEYSEFKCLSESWR